MNSIEKCSSTARLKTYLPAGGSKPKRPGNSGDPSSSSGGSLPLGSRTYPSLSEVSPTFSGPSGIEHADADEVSRSLTRTPSPSTAQKKKQKGKGKTEIGSDHDTTNILVPDSQSKISGRHKTKMTNSLLVLILATPNTEQDPRNKNPAV